MKISHKTKEDIMLIRFIINNVLSFGQTKEFNMLPLPRLRTLKNHIINSNDIELLKIASIYGANGAGKSNLIKSLGILQQIIIEEEIPADFSLKQFKFREDEKNLPQEFVIEFFSNNTLFIYGIKILDGSVIYEELNKSGVKSQKDEIIYSRKTNTKGETILQFSDMFEQDEKSQVLKNVLLEDFIKPDKSIFKLLANRENKYLDEIKIAYEWFINKLQIIRPITRPMGLAHKLEIDSEFKKYADNIMCSFDLGIKSLKTEKIELEDFFGTEKKIEMERVVRDIEKSPNKIVLLRNRQGEEVLFTKEHENYYVKYIRLEHVSENNSYLFDINEESDGTIRLLDFIPAFHDITKRDKVYFIDEIERSIHPLLIRELIRKYSMDTDSKGQLVFTTHETNLLDQEIFRSDEIWFAEKDSHGSTDLYTLSDFKEHKTIDIRKGYLSGRYGSIPFLGNLRDLNWNGDDTQE